MKKAIIVGASSGIGKGLALKLVSEGYLVGITGRRAELLHAIKLTNPSAIFVESFDATDDDICRERLQKLVASLGGLDLLIYSSGVGHLNEALDYKLAKEVLELNVRAFTNVVNWAFLKFENQGHGHLVNISSVAGLRGSRFGPSYNASKAYQINYFEGLRQKSHKIISKIFLTDVRPGFVDTDMAKGDGIFWLMPVDKVARQIHSAIKSKRKVVYVTRRWGMIGRLLKILPRFIYDRM